MVTAEPDRTDQSSCWFNHNQFTKYMELGKLDKAIQFFAVSEKLLFKYLFV